MNDTAANWTRIAELVGADRYTLDNRLTLPLDRQVEVLMDLVCAQHPEFRRSIPVQATDHDVVLHDVLVKMVQAVAAERERCEALSRELDEARALLNAIADDLAIDFDDYVAAIRGGDDG